MKPAKFALAATFLAAAACFAPAPALAQNANSQPVIASYMSRGDCMEVKVPEGDIQLMTCHGGWNQGFHFLAGGNGMITLGQNQCLTATAAGVGLKLSECVDSKQQRWTFINDGTLRNEAGECADIEYATPLRGQRIISYDCHRNINQRWYAGVSVTRVELEKGRTGVFDGQDADVYVGQRGFSLDNIVGAGGGAIKASGDTVLGVNAFGLVRGGAGDQLAQTNGAVLRATGKSSGRVFTTPTNWSFFNARPAGGAQEHSAD